MIPKTYTSDICRYLILFLLILYYSIPKINIISIKQFGIRPLDIISLIIFFVVIIQSNIFKKNHLGYFSIFFLYVAIISILHNNEFGILYSLRLFQYILLGYALANIINSELKFFFLYTIVVIQISISVLQYIQFIPNFDPGRSIYYGKIFSGSFGTPAELSYFVICLYGLYFTQKYIRNIFLCTLLYFNTVILAPALLFLLNFTKIIKKFNKNIIVISPYFVIILFIIYAMGIDVFLEALTNIQQTAKLDKGGNLDHIEISEYVPKSAYYRIQKFFSAYYYLASNNLILFFGCGYGCGDGAIDSGLVRFLLEFGILGFISLFIISKKISIIPLAVMIAVNLSFDGFWSSVTAPVLFSYFFLDIKVKRSLYVYNQ